MSGVYGGLPNAVLTGDLEFVEDEAMARSRLGHSPYPA
jgi:hypothetical protein